MYYSIDPHRMGLNSSLLSTMAANTTLSSDSFIQFDQLYSINTTITPTNQTMYSQSPVLFDPSTVQTSTTRDLILSMASTIAAKTTRITFTTSRPTNVSTQTTWLDWFSSAHIQIPLYATILLLTLVGNTLVIMTLVQNRRMRTITNVFLLNLAVSDILLGVFCMPFTLIGTQLRDFVFGEILCKLIPYLQGNWMFSSPHVLRPLPVLHMTVLYVEIWF